MGVLFPVVSVLAILNTTAKQKPVIKPVQETINDYYPGKDSL
jgi:hypothetical protein